MPTYTYRCEKCDTQSDYRMSMNETKPSMELPCTICEEETKQNKMITSTGGFQLKGNGWFNKGGY